MTGSARLDQYLVARGLARARNQARELIRAGQVTVDGQVVTKPSYAVRPELHLEVTATGRRWVGRGALKLLRALELWSGQGLDVPGRRCLDVGASTGGFTQVLLEHGAGHVTALDVGHGQLAALLAADPRVRDLPGTNIRGVSGCDLDGPFSLIVSDLSFISLTIALPHMVPLLDRPGDMVALVKPQFEVGRGHLARGGVVREADDHRRALSAVLDTVDELDLAIRGLDDSGLPGAHGNVEYLLWLDRGGPGMMSADERTARIEELTQEKESR